MAYTPPRIYWKPAAENHRTLGRTEPIRAIVNHRMVGTLPGTTSHFQNPDVRPVSTHFGIGKVNGVLQIHQYVAVDDTAYGNGNYDASGNWDDWGFKTTEVNAQTISIEHQDHWGDDSLKGIVLPEVQEASQWLQALLLRASETEWKKYGVRVRDWTNNFRVIRAELRNIRDNYLDRHHIINHNDIAGNLKPYCWKPWAKDTVGFPRTFYVTQIKARVICPEAIVPDPIPEPPPPPAPTLYTQEQLDAAVTAATTTLQAELTQVKATLADLNADLTAIRAIVNEAA